MMAEKVNLYDPKALAIGATILIIGIGGNIGFSGGFLPIPLLTKVFPFGWPHRHRRCCDILEPAHPGVKPAGRCCAKEIMLDQIDYIPTYRGNSKRFSIWCCSKKPRFQSSVGTF
jgi:hypothetical protein